MTAFEQQSYLEIYEYSAKQYFIREKQKENTLPSFSRWILVILPPVWNFQKGQVKKFWSLKKNQSTASTESNQEMTMGGG